MYIAYLAVSSIITNHYSDGEHFFDEDVVWYAGAGAEMAPPADLRAVRMHDDGPRWIRTGDGELGHILHFSQSRILISEFRCYLQPRLSPYDIRYRSKNGG